jgi:hypothetical protein
MDASLRPAHDAAAGEHSQRTSGRNQLARSLEAAAKSGEHAFVLLAVEEEVEDLDVSVLVASGCPHLDAAERKQVESRFLGQRTWTDLCEATNVDWRSLPAASGIVPKQQSVEPA